MAGPSGATGRLQLPYPIPNDTVDPPRDVKALADAVDAAVFSVPVGGIMIWALTTAPAGWLLCDGAAVPDNFPRLKALMTSVPDLRTRVPVGVGTGRALGASGGAASVQLAAAQTPIRDHDHNLGAVNAGGTPPANSSAGSINGGSKQIAIGGTAAGGTTRTMGLPITGQYYWGLAVGAVAGNPVAVSAHENMPPFIVLNFIIFGG